MMTKQPTLAELKVAAHVLLEEGPSLVAGHYSLRHQETIRLLLMNRLLRQDHIHIHLHIPVRKCSRMPRS
jgi:hypothetical protein